MSRSLYLPSLSHCLPFSPLFLSKEVDSYHCQEHARSSNFCRNMESGIPKASQRDDIPTRWTQSSILRLTRRGWNTPRSLLTHNRKLADFDDGASGNSHRRIQPSNCVVDVPAEEFGDDKENIQHVPPQLNLIRKHKLVDENVRLQDAKASEFGGLPPRLQ